MAIHLSLQAEMMNMKAVIITIGDEILIGQVLDTNSTWIAEHLNLMGIIVEEMISISDKREHILSTLNRYEGKVELIILTGGLGPTSDDITKKTIADYFNMNLVENAEVLGNIYELFGSRGMKVSEANRQQASVPEYCRILRNPSGTAPGMWLERNGSIFISVPGVPYEMMDIFNTSVLPELSKLLDGIILVHQTVLTQGIPESYLSETLKDWEFSLPENIKLAYLPRPGIVRLRLTGVGDNRDKLNEQISAELTKLKLLIPEDIYGLNDESLEKVIGDILRRRRETMVTAESCTGGNIARLITGIPGSSDYYLGSVIAYSNQFKTDQLGVDPQLIKEQGAVSQLVVEKMAEEARKKFNADFSIATSGIAGPGGGTPEKPIGTTWIAISSKNNTISKRYYFGEHRGRNIEKASYAALNLFRKILLGIPVKSQ